MLKSGLFSVIFKVDNVEMREEYQLAYRTEEVLYLSQNMLNKRSTLYQQATSSIEKDLGMRRSCVEIVKIIKIHNDLILEDEQ